MDSQRWMRFFAPDAQVRSLGLSCLGVGVQRGHLLTVGPRSVNRHVAVVVRAGQGWFCGDGESRVEVVAPAVLWLLPGEEHHYGVDPATGWDEFFVCFDGPATALYTTMGFLPHRTSWSPLADIGPIEAIRTRMLSLVRPDNPLLDVEAAVMVHDLLLALRSALSVDPRERAEQDLIAELTRNAFLPMSVTDHSHRLGISVEQLRTLVRRRTGRSPKDYLLTVRLEHAQELLSATELSTAEIGRIVGYPDAAYFSRLFSKRLAVSPSVFRSQCRGRSRGVQGHRQSSS